jgi:hypothetical protein
MEKPTHAKQTHNCGKSFSTLGFYILASWQLALGLEHDTHAHPID